MQLEFRDFLEDVIQHSGPEDWLVWATQYRNMFVHRGRRIIMSHFEESDVILYGANHQPLPPRMNLESHLAIEPEKTDVEAMVKTRTVILNENAKDTIDGIFQSTRDLIETVC